MNKKDYEKQLKEFDKWIKIDLGRWSRCDFCGKLIDQRWKTMKENLWNNGEHSICDSCYIRESEF